MTLTEFLLARIAEDEVVANQAVGYESRVYWDSAARDLHLRAQSLAHYMRHDPARVLAECEAKRHIVEWHTAEAEERREWGESCCEERVGPIEMLAPDEREVFAGTTWDGGLSVRESFATQERYGCVTLMMLALPFADHPDYREEWRP